jgi:hypothetical protein
VHPQDADPPLPVQSPRQEPQQQLRQGVPTPFPVSVAEVAAAARTRGSSLYRSPLQHAAMSVKVSPCDIIVIIIIIYLCSDSP